MADNKRRDEEPEDELELFDDDVVDADDADDEEDAAPVSGPRRGGTATKERPKADRVRRDKDSDRVGPFARIGRFVREVVAELRKVIWPTRKELLTYTAVVVVFVAVMLTIVALLDTGFAWLVLKVFGGPSPTEVTPTGG